MINWKVRFKNKIFWTSLIPAVLLFVKAVANGLGMELDVTPLTASLVDIIETAFVVLTILGVVNDPTTAGMSDSFQAMGYSEPKKEG